VSRQTTSEWYREAWLRQVEAVTVLTDFEHTRLQDELNKEDGP
jgi:hypothetical protein